MSGRIFNTHDTLSRVQKLRDVSWSDFEPVKRVTDRRMDIPAVVSPALCLACDADAV